MVGVVCFDACGSSKRVVTTATSPDSLVDAAIYVEGGGGATVGLFYEVRLQPRGNGSGHGLTVFDGYGLPCLDIHWEDKDTLVIRYNDSRGQAALSRGSPVQLPFGSSKKGVDVRLEHAPTFKRDSTEGLGCVN